MFRFFAVIIALMVMVNIDTLFAACSAGYYEKTITFPTNAPAQAAYYGCTGNISYPELSIKLKKGEWGATWTYGAAKGTVRGVATCKLKSGTYASTSGSSDTWTSCSTDNNCWCKITQWIDSNGDTTNLSAAWVYIRETDYKDCRTNCASYCREQFDYSSNFRSAAFGSVTNTTSCTACPGDGTSAANNTGGITACYIPTTTDFTDDIGTYHFSEACYYTE